MSSKAETDTFSEQLIFLEKMLLSDIAIADQLDNRLELIQQRIVARVEEIRALRAKLNGGIRLP